MQKEKLPTHLKAAVTEFLKKHEASRDATNAANREKTALRNVVKDHWAREQLPIGSFIRSGGMDFKYEATETTKINPEAVLELLEKGEINREQFLRMVNIDKSQAKNVLGGDQVAAFEITTVGKTADIRIDKTPIDEIDEEFLGITTKERIRRRKRIGVAKPKEAAPRSRAKRKIKTRVTK